MDTIKKLVARARLKLERARADHGWVDVSYRTFKRFGEDEGGPLAAALTYYTFFSIFPMLLFGAAILGYLTFGNEELQRKILESSLDTVPILKDALTPLGLETIMANKQNLALVGAVMTLYAGSGAIVAFEHALNKINHVDDRPNFFQKRLRSVIWLAVLGVAALVSLAMSFTTGFAPGTVAPILSFAGGIVVNVAIFATAYRFLTVKEQSWRDVLPGAGVAAVLFEVLKLVGTAYLARGEATRDTVFGTFAAAAALLIASYLIAQISLMAAEVNAVLDERRLARQSSPATQGGLSA